VIRGTTEDTGIEGTTDVEGATGETGVKTNKTE